MKLRALPASLFLVLLVAGCAKHKCKLDTDGKKSVFGDVAAMTKGAHSCDVEGYANIGGMVEPSLHCEVGAQDCVGNLRAIHPNMQPDAVAAQYKAFLEPAGWKVSQNAYQSTRANGKPLTGTQLRAEKGDRVLISKVYMLGDTLAEANTMALDRSKITQR